MTLKEQIEVNISMASEILSRTSQGEQIDMETASRLNTINAKTNELLRQQTEYHEKQNEFLIKLVNRLNGAKPDPSCVTTIKVNVPLAIDLIQSIGSEMCDLETLKDLAILVLDAYFAHLEFIQGLDEENKALLAQIEQLKNKA